MNVRPASFRDLSRVEQIHREAMAGDEAATPLSSERTLPQATVLVRLWYGVSRTMSALMPLTAADDLLFVAEHPAEGIVGFVQAEAAAGKPRAWQVVNLCTTTTPVGRLAPERLLSGLAHAGQAAGIQRLHVRVPLDHALVPAFVEQGFTQYATEQILFAERPEGGPPAAPARLARREDKGSLYLLYLRTTPAAVAAIEGSSRTAWESAFAGGMVSRLGRDATRHLVVEHGGIVAWAAVRPAAGMRPALMTLLCDAMPAAEREHFIEIALAEAGAGPVSCVLRHYDSELIRALQLRGFQIYGTQVLLVRDIAARIRVRAPQRAARKKSVLAPVGLVRSVPNPVAAPHPLHVLANISASGLGRSEKSSLR